MCGIAGIYVKDPSIIDTENDRIQFDRFFDELLLGIEERGTDATGFITASGTKIQMDKKPIPAESFIKTRKRAWLSNGTRMVLGHTRFATQGHQSQFENNHPVMYGTTFVTHNGHIHNDDVVYDDLKLERYAEVDSSAIAAALDFHGFNEDDSKAALEMLGGGFAIAAINPVSAVDTLLLAKGGGMYPLAYIETNYVLVWASTSHAITEAWKSVLGTPPPAIKVKYLANGDMMWVKDGKTELNKSAFTPKPKYAYQSRTQTGASCGSRVGFSWDGWPSDEERPDDPPPRASRGVQTIMDNAAYIGALRNNGGGRAITWERKDTMTDEQRKLYDGKWSTCLHCKAMIASFCFIRHLTWGDTCWDCLAYGNSKLTAKGADYADMSKEDLDQLDEYAVIELDFIDTIIAEMVKETGLSDRLIWWLIFCSGMVNLGWNTDKLKEKLQFLYADKEAEFFDRQEDNNGSFIEDTPIPPTHQIEQGSSDMGKCDHCKKKAKLLLFEHGRQFRWCIKHIDKCFKRGCKGDPVAWGPDGRRWCHSHSRHVKGLSYIEKATVTT